MRKHCPCKSAVPLTRWCTRSRPPRTSKWNKIYLRWLRHSGFTRCDEFSLIWLSKSAVPPTRWAVHSTHGSASRRCRRLAEQWIQPMAQQVGGAADSLSNAFNPWLSKSAVPPTRWAVHSTHGSASRRCRRLAEQCVQPMAQQVGGAADSLSSAFNTFLSKSAGAADSLSCINII